MQRLVSTAEKALARGRVREARILGNFGFEGCAPARRAGNRQVLLVDRETLEAAELPPGILRENITTDGLHVNSFARGDELRTGDVRLEVTMASTPSNQMERIGPGLGKETPGQARQAVPRREWRNRPSRRPHRKATVTGT